ncbi:synaptotagmin-1 [Dunckerocampus dactyliophorus]|uniref:synaptotagmin-1 n=1 Tax=Dunckerocampus dactyliophorus TaxID=161453 RepID=UPI002404E6F2|nr:synaptotagmin-1 [Dunckerocampus dactyliophorus]XP_054632903.1 synaptotagmin-1 [Dunckerocampus dactyliophorus]XP_054632906.1 synaptotagmin-1 [Dunckerocampus dactyliophorus]
MIVLPTDYLASARLLPSAAALRFPFSAAVKYSILGLSVSLLLVALGILAWQAFKCLKRPRTTTARHEAVNGELLNLDDVSQTGQNKGIPIIKVEDVDADILSQTSLRSSQAAAEDKVNGWLHYSVYYDQQQRQLVVTVLELEGLQHQSQISSLQLFVQLKLLWKGSEKEERCIKDGDEGTPLPLCTVLQDFQTRIVKGTCNPLFGDQFSCILHDEKELNHIHLRMEVRDYDKYSRHKALGEVRTSLGQFNISYPLELKGKLHSPRKDLVGEVLLSLKFLPTSQRLEVGVLKVRTVHKELHVDAALYARISVHCNRSKLKYQKTSAMKPGTVTVFNEVLVFSLPDFGLQECKILVSIFETHSSRKPSKHLIGQLAVKKDKHSEDKHWGLMIRSARQPIAMWHALVI